MKLFLLVFGVCLVECHVGPKYPPTKGEVWPKPHKQIKYGTVYIINTKEFDIKTSVDNCALANIVVNRYTKLFQQWPVESKRKVNENYVESDNLMEENEITQELKSDILLHELQVFVKNPCKDDFPSLGMDESYNLTVKKGDFILTTYTVWGLMRGLETVSQLFYYSDDYKEVLIDETVIFDYPRYRYRGLLVDTSRHYIPVESILTTLDAMEMNKMNVFHWHIVDDESFPYQSVKFPEFSKKGAYHASMVYTPRDIRKVINYAKVRGIRVVPEFDIPGHVDSWGTAHPEILANCPNSDKKALNPINKKTYNLLKEFLREVQKTFPDKYIHLGGDEVPYDCWNDDRIITEFMAKNKRSTRELQAAFSGKTVSFLKKGTAAMFWEEVFYTSPALPKDKTIIQTWRSADSMYSVLKAGYLGVQSAYYYLDNMSKNFGNYYQHDPRREIKRTHPDVNPTLLARLVGGEACMWGEMMDERNIISRVWPRASAVAEVLWSITDLVVTDKVLRRVEEHTCRMIRRGVPAEPSTGPGFCVVL